MEPSAAYDQASPHNHHRIADALETGDGPKGEGEQSADGEKCQSRSEKASEGSDRIGIRRPHFTGGSNANGDLCGGGQAEQR